ncbi:phage tail tape measure protein [Streptomyces sp. NPDC059247]|uniref:phage tail tape measure protein n=1 Tax=Streptomyces sp. NPDC059247 TaxID=3346790 RepID=UPI00367757A3
MTESEGPMGRPANLRINITSDSRQAQADVAQTTSRVGGALDKLKTAGPGMAAGAALAIGAAIVQGIGEALAQGKIAAKLGAQLGATPAEAQRYGKVAGKLFTEGITDDFQGAADAIKATMSAGLLPTGATEAQVKKIATKVSDLSSTFEQDSSQVARAVAQMVKTGMADSSEQAFDILTRGFQSGNNAADDLLDTYSEYSTQFRKLGLDGSQAMGLITQGLAGGATSADLVADSLKELSIRVVDGSKTTADGFKAIGLNADDMAARFGKGGKTAAEALDLTMDRLSSMPDPVAKAQAQVALFGTQSEDLGRALDSMDPSYATKALGEVGGAADKMGKSLRDNASSRIEQFQRGAQQALVDFIGAKVLPMLDRFVEFWRKYLSPVVQFYVQLLRNHLQPVMDAVRQGFDKVRKAFEENRAKLQPLIDAFKKYLLPALVSVSEWVGKLAGKVVGVLFDALAGTVDLVADVVDGFVKLVRWVKDAINWLGRLKAPSWLSSIGDFMGTFSLATEAPAAAVAAAPRAATVRTWARSIAVPVSVTVVIDGEQLQGRITRTVSGALQAEGARYLAGGWA